ncbi:MAG: hypothetical protein J5867_04065 [Prevotella sp.]|nr:hypothetical protein [Prevotella sp.]
MTPYTYYYISEMIVKLMLPGTITYDDGTTVDDEATKGNMIDEGDFDGHRVIGVWE